MPDSVDPKPWWDSQLEWNLPDSLHDTMRMGQRLLRNIPATLSAYKLGKTTPQDHLEPDPVERITVQVPKPFSEAAQAPAETQPEGKQGTRPLPKILPPPPRPPALQRREQQGQWILSGNNPARSNTAPVVRTGAQPAAQPAERCQPYVLPPLGSELAEKPFRPTDAAQEAKVAKVSGIVEQKHLTLEQLLDPDFCDYTT